MEAQACGAIPVTNPVWAVRENVLAGVLIEGDLNEPATQAEYVLQTCKLLLEPERQEEIRREMMPKARRVHDWDKQIALFETWALEDMKKRAAGAKKEEAA
jgi:glycosyltransferase involved in cell wall biosynthesis